MSPQGILFKSRATVLKITLWKTALLPKELPAGYAPEDRNDDDSRAPIHIAPPLAKHTESTEIKDSTEPAGGASTQGMIAQGVTFGDADVG